MFESRSCAALRTVLRIVCDILRLISTAGPSRAQLAAENLFLRKQLAMYVERQVKPHRADDATRIVLVVLSGLIDWRRVLIVVRPDTLMRWHRKDLQLFWRWKSRPRGRPAGLDRRNGGGESDLAGRGTDCRGTAGETWDSRVAPDREALRA
jgi:hypothetical protein